MKNRMRLAASVFPSFPGEWRRKFISVIGICPSFSRLHCRELESLGRAMHDLSCEDDFSELGPPVNENGAKQLRLATEKPEPQMAHQRKANSAPQGKLSWQLSSEDRPSLMKIILGTRNISRVSKVRVQDRSDTPSSAVRPNQNLDHDKGETLDSSCYVSIKNVPSTFTLADLVKAMSVFGKVSSARIRNVSDDLHHCDVEFANSESSRRAALAGEVTIENIHLPIRASNSLDLVTIRIEGIDTETPDVTVHRTCKSIGALVGLEMDGKDAVNAFFRVKSDEELQTILKRLNNTVVDDLCWSAKQFPCQPASRVVPQKEERNSELGLKATNYLDALKWKLEEKLAVKRKLERQLAMQKLPLQDLQLLHQGIIHIQVHEPL